MTQLSINQALSAAHSGGFTLGSTQVLIVAIAMAESGLRSDAYNGSDPYGGSWGILQINGSHFLSGATTKSCALDPPCAFSYGFTLSNGGKDFTPWGSYTNGSYKQFEKQVADVFNQINPQTDPCLAGLKDGTPWQNVPACQPWNIPCFDLGQCLNYINGGLKVSAMGPPTSQTGPLAAGESLGQALQGVGNFFGWFADRRNDTRLVKAAIGVVLLLFGLYLYMNTFIPHVLSVVKPKF